MLTKEKSLYQVKLILHSLPLEEYEMIPDEIIEEIENNLEYDENIIIDPSIPLQEQDIDDKTYEMLDKIIKKVENLKNIEEIEESEEIDLEEENIKLKNIIEALKEENSKIPKAKMLLEDYKEVIREKDEEISRLKINNERLYKSIEKLPKIIRKIFMKDIKSLLP